MKQKIALKDQKLENIQMENVIIYVLLLEIDKKSL
jgi:hypothetical protein